MIMLLYIGDERESIPRSTLGEERNSNRNWGRVRDKEEGFQAGRFLSRQ